MAFELNGNLYRVAIGSEHNFIYVSAYDQEDLIRYLAATYTKEQVFGAKSIGRDGYLNTVPIVTDPLFNELASDHLEAEKLPSSADFRDVYVLSCTHETKFGMDVYSSAHESYEAASSYVDAVKYISNYDPENVNEVFNFKIHRDVIDVNSLHQIPSIHRIAKKDPLMEAAFVEEMDKSKIVSANPSPLAPDIAHENSQNPGHVGISR